MQYLNPIYWHWEDNKVTLFDDWQTNKKEIFEQIYNSVKGMQGFEEIALIVHDKDRKGNGTLK
ncbi:MAG: plasmid replication protein, partial [Bacilli bacterium]|nr:plasmid replication protein [Bacilli bacterium]